MLQSIKLDDEIEIEVVKAYFKALFQLLPGEMKKTHQDKQHLRQESNPGSSDSRTELPVTQYLTLHNMQRLHETQDVAISLQNIYIPYRHTPDNYEARVPFSVAF
jgi:DNA-binding GntR family transcriptional regulator